MGGLENFPMDEYHKTMKVCAEGVFLGIRAASGSMKKRSKVAESASIVNVSSVAGLSGNMGPFDCRLLFFLRAWASYNVVSSQKPNMLPST
jgi:NAD(P)-dependent dehydrogenase (short-subunit alcohol dehydrogenase family)